jgi:hypothetical protein
MAEAPARFGNPDKVTEIEMLADRCQHFARKAQEQQWPPQGPAIGRTDGHQRCLHLFVDSVHMNSFLKKKVARSPRAPRAVLRGRLQWAIKGKSKPDFLLFVGACDASV